MSNAEYRFVIDALTPETLSLARLAAYLGELGKFLGDEPGLHFDRIESGSAVLVTWADEPAHPKVMERISRVRRGDGPPEAVKAEKALNDLLREDGAVGSLRVGAAVVIPFPGRTIPRPESIGPVHQPTTIEGQLIRIGGRDKTVPFQLLDGDRTWNGNTSRDMAREMSRHLFGATLRVAGTGVWNRDGDGTWTLDRFQAASFEALDDAPLSEALARVCAVAVFDSDDPLAVWRDMRGNRKW